MRNELGEAELYEYDETHTECYPSTLSVFEEIRQCYSKRTFIKQYELPDKHVFVLSPGTYVRPGLLPPGIPCLDTINFIAKPVGLHINVFGNKSRHDSMLLITNVQYSEGQSNVHLLYF